MDAPEKYYIPGNARKEKFKKGPLQFPYYLKITAGNTKLRKYLYKLHGTVKVL
jgi:hypothetical protein